MPYPRADHVSCRRSPHRRCPASSDTRLPGGSEPGELHRPSPTHFHAPAGDPVDRVDQVDICAVEHATGPRMGQSTPANAPAPRKWDPGSATPPGASAEVGTEVEMLDRAGRTASRLQRPWSGNVEVRARFSAGERLKREQTAAGP